MLLLAIWDLEIVSFVKNKRQGDWKSCHRSTLLRTFMVNWWSCLCLPHDLLRETWLGRNCSSLFGFCKGWEPKGVIRSEKAAHLLCLTYVSPFAWDHQRTLQHVLASLQQTAEGITLLFMLKFPFRAGIFPELSPVLSRDKLAFTEDLVKLQHEANYQTL